MTEDEMSLLQLSKYGLISFEIHETGNYVVQHRNQEIIVMPGAFQRIAKSGQKAQSGRIPLPIDAIQELGFIIK